MIGGLTAASLCYYVFGRRLSSSTTETTPIEKEATKNPGFLKIIEISGSEAIAIVIRIIPMLLLSLLLVFTLQAAGLVSLLTELLSPVFTTVGLSTDLILSTLTKFIADSTVP